MTSVLARRTCLRRGAMAIALALLGLPLPAQTVATRTVGKPVAEYAEPFTVLMNARELSDGRVLVTDAQERTVHLVDAKLASAVQVGRQGGGPAEYRYPTALVAAGGDTTLVYDIAGLRFLVIDPSGKVGQTISLQSLSGGLPVGPAAVRGYDRAGRLYYQGMNFTMAGGKPEFSDSAALIRLDGGTKRLDTLAFVRANAPKMAVSGDMQKGTGSMKVGVSPFPITDEWVLLGDGRVVVVRGATYRVDQIGADGKLRPGALVPYAKVKVTEKDKEAARANTKRMREAMGRASADARAAAGASGGRMPAMAVDEPTEWPEYKPAFGPLALHVAPEGTIWVHRLREAGADAPLYDVIDPSGKLLHRVQLPPKTRLLAIGAKFLYLARSDADDLQYLGRYAR
jgi:hypothetical protein